MELSEIENKLKFNFPARHRQALLDSADPIHRACEFLTLLDILSENEWIRSSEFGDPWPDFLIAFASNGCGDYFAYDTRQNPATIIYIDPDNTVAENLQASDKASHETFEEWYEANIERYTCQRCQSREARFEVSEDKQYLERVCPDCGFRERTDVIEP